MGHSGADFIVLLGVYDVFKKLSLNKNAVLPVLMGSTITGAVLVSPMVIGSFFFPEFFKGIYLFVPKINLHEHVLIFLKAVIVVSSWILAFHALKHLPLTIVAPLMQPGRYGRWLAPSSFFRSILIFCNGSASWLRWSLSIFYRRPGNWKASILEKIVGFCA